MKKLFIIFTFTTLALVVYAQNKVVQPWAADIAAFKKQDSAQMPKPGGIVFTGSSSIRMWKTLATDFKGQNAINRGFGGSQISDLIRYSNELIFKYKPSKVVLYSGDNDLAAGKTPKQVVNDYSKLINLIHKKMPEVPVYIIAIKPSESRWQLIEEIKAANNGIKNLAQLNNKIIYVDIFTPMTGNDGHPKKEFFLDDQLHMNEQGYKLWTDILIKLL